MNALAHFLLMQIAEDEAAARALDWMPRWVMAEDLPRTPRGVVDHLMRHDPARVLAECEAKRRVVTHASAVATCGGYAEPGSPERGHYEEMIAEFGDTARHLPDAYSPGCDGCAAAESVATSDGWVLRFLALPFADREGYREEWKP